MTDAERLLAILEIQQLAHRYAVSLDARDLDKLVALYVPDVRVTRETSGREALRADFDRSLRAVGATFLQVGNHVVDFADDSHATGVVYTRGEIQDGGPDSTRWIIHAIQYHDAYEKRDGRWLFARRKHLLVYGADLGTNPLTLPPANWPQSQTGRGTVPWSLESWQRFWKK
ncbi:MAG: nuclear transport factor 2 family protein [Deltaproteobacteria bacterium]|nr:nuclear transport factor 2 family protein [Deltaproteobacteria bacterium]